MRSCMNFDIQWTEYCTHITEEVIVVFGMVHTNFGRFLMYNPGKYIIPNKRNCFERDKRDIDGFINIFRKKSKLTFFLWTHYIYKDQAEFYIKLYGI